MRSFNSILEKFYDVLVDVVIAGLTICFVLKLLDILKYLNIIY